MSRDLIVRIFAILQGIILTVIVVGIYLYRRREKERDESVAIKLAGINTRLNRTERPETRPKKERAPEQSSPTTAQLESAFPSWPDGTSPEQILGVQPGADEATVEAAYKAALKRYHPDRFAHWGSGYQRRAHHIVLLLQKAREDLLKKKA